MNTFHERIDYIAQTEDYDALADALEDYALAGIACRSQEEQQMALKALKKMLKDHLLREFGKQICEPGCFSYFIRSGPEAYLPYVYCKLMDLGCFGNYDLGHVLSISRKMKSDYEPADSTSIDEVTVMDIMRWMDLKYHFTTTTLSTIPMFLIMDRAPVKETASFLREGCEVSAYAFVFWKARKNTLLTAPHETAFLLRISDEIVREAWMLTEQEYLSYIKEELDFLGYTRIGKMNEMQARKLVSDLVCIGIAYDSPFQRYIPFLGQSREYLQATTKIVEKLLAAVKEKRGF